MKHWLVGSLVAVALGGVAGCYVEDQTPVYYEGTDDGNADLVEVSPGVEVIADWAEPVFFYNNYYWVNRGGSWYWSTWYGGGWAINHHPPGGIVGIAHPEQYAHYKPAGWAPHEHVAGGEAAHAQYHAAHASAGVHVRAAGHGGHR
jgi:hypothetical protein